MRLSNASADVFEATSSDVTPAAKPNAMQLAKDINAFGKACEHLIASMAIHRPITEEERLSIRHYCNELLEITASPMSRAE